MSKEIEKKIIGKISAIASGTLAIKGCGVNDLIIRLRKTDEATAEVLQKKYIDTIKSINK